MMLEEAESAKGRNFLEENIDEDLRSGHYQQVVTRFPPEPNGYLHIGHAKAICINFTTALKYKGKCNLRMDDTNPSKEDTEYVESIKEDIQWLGFQWAGLYFASDYFDKMFECAIKLIKKGSAFVCDLTAEQIKEYRGTLTQPGKESPYRKRSIEENLELFLGMRDGKYADGERVLRAKIDMASPNINMRDPVIYRILRATHHNTGDKWCIYPMYDYAHPIEDAIEGVTHSMCSLEFEDHRPLYDWVIQETIEEWAYPPRQMEFARLNLTRTVMSKRHLKRLVDTKLVSGWDDPRMPTLGGLRRRGYTPASLRDFCERIGVAKANSLIESAFLEHCIREELNATAPRAMAVLNPVKVILTNYPEGQTEYLEAENSPLPEDGTRKIPFSREIYIEREDFMEDPPNKFFRLAPGREVRLKSAYIIKCEGVIKDAEGNIQELHCTYDTESRSGMEGANRKVKGTLHWVEAGSCVDATIRLYDYLFRELTEEEEEQVQDISERLNPDSLTILTGCKVEPMLGQAQAGSRYQFLREGYFIMDKDSTAGKPVFNRIVGLKDSYAKQS